MPRIPKVAASICTLTVLASFAISCKRDADKTKATKNTAIAKPSEMTLTGKELANLDFDLHRDLQEQINTNVRPAFEKCGENWGSMVPYGSAFFGQIELTVSAKGDSVRISNAANITRQKDKESESYPFGEEARACVERSFEGLVFENLRKETFDLRVDYPFCIRKPARCPEIVSLPSEDVQEFFSGLPDWNEAHHPLLEEILGESDVGEYRQCRCGVCRIVATQDSLDETNTWMLQMQERMMDARSRYPTSEIPTMKFVNQRPVEFQQEPSFGHVYLNFTTP